MTLQFDPHLVHDKVIRLQRSGIDTIKYHTWPRIPMGKWQTHRRHHKREPRGQPFPSRWPQSTYKQTRTKHSKHKTEQKHKRSTKEVPPWNDLTHFWRQIAKGVWRSSTWHTFTLIQTKLAYPLWSSWELNSSKWCVSFFVGYNC